MKLEKINEQQFNGLMENGVLPEEPEKKVFEEKNAETEEKVEVDKTQTENTENTEE